jgi:DNA-binding LacI/PurR family transcriptional regulator
LSHGDPADAGEPQRPRGDPSAPVTVSYIAESAGVSIPRVSKDINGRRGVAADTRARVEALIDHYGYRRPAPSTRNTMELVFDELEEMWGMEIIRGVERVARQHRMGVVLTEFGPERSAQPPSSPATTCRHSGSIAPRTLGLRIPADLSVVGFDDLPIAALIDPPLTTVHQPLTEMAAAATELALALARGEKRPRKGLELATTLTVRESTAPPLRT